MWTYDPRNEVSLIPMELFPRQREFLLWLEEREANQEDGLVEKSRDMGATWLCVAFLVHHWLFRDGFKGGMGSRKLELVDRLGDPDSIFEKIRLLLRNLPKWMLPPGFDWKAHANFCKLLNPAIGAALTGEGGDEIGRGGRSSVFFVDEAAFIEHPKTVDAALSANTNVRIDVSTPHGNANAFADKRNSGRVPVFVFDWRDDPRKNGWELRDSAGEVADSGPGGTHPPEDIPAGCALCYPWYEAQKAKLDEVTLAQEVDRDYTASVEGIAIPAKWVRAAVDLDKRCHLPVSRDVVAGLDVADGGACDTVLIVRRGCVVTQIHSRREGGSTDITNWAIEVAKAAGARVLNYDAPGVGAGIAGTIKARSREMPLGISTTGINVGASPTEALWPDGKTSKEKFANLKAELWWIARRRFEKTYELVELGTDHRAEELISIPNNPDLIRELSSVKAFQTEAGKTVIESKQQLSARGVKSPDYADAFILTFAPERKPARAAVGGQRAVVKQYVPR